MASQTKLNVPAALVELFSDPSNTCFNATSCSRLGVEAFRWRHGDTRLRGASAMAGSAVAIPGTKL